MNILTRYPIHEDDLVKLNELKQVQVFQSDQLTHEAETKIDVIFGWDDTAQRVLNNPNNQVQFIQTYSAGVDYLPKDIILANNILVANSSGIHGKYIAQMVLGYLLAFSRGIQSAMVSQSQHAWTHTESRNQMFELAGRRALIMGTGHIGSAVGQLLQQFDITTIGANRSGNLKKGFDEVVTSDTLGSAVESNFVINTMPLTLATTDFFDATFFARMKPQAIFINVGRGGSVDTDALTDALSQQLIGGAAIDVVAPEPLAPDSELWDLPNVIITPHISGGVPHLRRKLFDILLTNLTSLQATGRLSMNEVDMRRGY